MREPFLYAVALKKYWLWFWREWSPRSSSESKIEGRIWKLGLLARRESLRPGKMGSNCIQLERVIKENLREGREAE
jgi:hypothetical protein